MKKLNWIFYIKYVLLFFLLIFMIRLLSGSGTSSTPAAQINSDVTSAINMDMLSAADHRMFKRLYGINANDYEDVRLYVSGSNMEVEELLIVKLKDQSQAESVESAINTRLEKQLQSFEGYGPEQCKLLEDHILDVRGNYILFIVHNDAAAADKAFRKSL
ncbi:MAG: DUF4358 domain-containing protein [Coprococcus sp.]